MGNKQDFSAEKQSLKDKLMAIILLETSKDYKEMDSNLVTECVDFLMELEGKQRLTKAEIEQRVNEIPFKGKITAIGSYAKKRIRIKKLAIIAAVLAFIFVLFSIFAFATGNNPIELLKQMGHAIIEMIDGETVDVGGVTIYAPHKTKEYDSIETLLKEEEIDILYPTWLPGNEEIVSVLYLFDEQAESYILQCNNVTYNINVNLNATISDDVKNDCTEERIGNLDLYYFVEENFTQAYFEYDNNLYRINSDTKENLFKIIENLREIN